MFQTASNASFKAAAKISAGCKSVNDKKDWKLIKRPADESPFPEETTKVIVENLEFFDGDTVTLEWYTDQVGGVIFPSKGHFVDATGKHEDGPMDNDGKKEQTLPKNIRETKNRDIRIKLTVDKNDAKVLRKLWYRVICKPSDKVGILPGDGTTTAVFLTASVEPTEEATLTPTPTPTVRFPTFAPTATWFFPTFTPTPTLRFPTFEPTPTIDWTEEATEFPTEQATEFATEQATARATEFATLAVD
jgi:hypothetical protein